MKKSFPFEYETWIAGTAFLNRREKGAYIDLLCVQADKGHLTMEMIKDILNGDFDCWEKIKSKFIEENGRFYNKKLEIVKQGRHRKTEAELAGDREKIEKQIYEKKQKFYNDCKPYLAKYSKDMLRCFYNYWTEMNKSGTRLRFELQQTFEIGKRLGTWASKDKEFIKKETYKTYQEMIELERKNPGIWKDSYECIKIEGKVFYKLK